MKDARLAARLFLFVRRVGSRAHAVIDNGADVGPDEVIEGVIPWA